VAEEACCPEHGAEGRHEVAFDSGQMEVVGRCNPNPVQEVSLEEKTTLLRRHIYWKFCMLSLLSKFLDLSKFQGLS